ncbi:hypothetical protein JG688_00017155 [Phytophthora aleatoria]|uniref:Uncharacterized protein n=1 Tax=Phytophthora aleatoria TaxID=2496075 RepID=A0A8J5IB01_9STRA|nr:hypothetical protein JG688_00017155 [Phytophthora aleatoria]
MGGRRETRRESDAFKARLEGRSSEDRHRLAAEHRAYLAGERATDADFGPGEAPVAQASQPAHVPRPAKTPSRPPIGKAAAYLAALKKRMAENDGERVDTTQAPKDKKRRAKGKRSVSTTHSQSEGSGKPKELTQKEKAALANEEKAAQEAIAVSRARAEATKKTLARAKERHTADMEAKRGAEARAAALKRLKEKKEKNACSAQKKGEKDQETAVASVGAEKKKRRTCPHDASGDDDADDESNISSSTRYDGFLGTGDAPQTRLRTLVLVVSNSPEPEAVSVALPADQTSGTFGCAGMDSDVEEDSSESENWYFEDHDGVEDETESEVLREEEEGAEEEETDSDENHLDGAAIIARRKNNEAKRRASKRLKEAVAKLRRDWNTTTESWDILTREEMAVLAQDTKALEKNAR